jgi:putative ABC transport system substrate-binding protein
MGNLPFLYQGLKATGFVEGKNISIEFRLADGHYDRLPALAAELVDRHVSVLLAMDVPSAFVAKAMTKTIPVVFAIGVDPVKVGLVESFSRPNGNLTSMSISSSVPGPKRVELLHELLPEVNAIGVLGNPGNANALTLKMPKSSISLTTSALRIKTVMQDGADKHSNDADHEPI